MTDESGDMATRAGYFTMAEQQGLVALLLRVAGDEEDVAINSALVCNFCGRDVRHDDYEAVGSEDEWASGPGHRANCGFLLARRIVRRLVEESAVEPPEWLEAEVQ